MLIQEHTATIEACRFCFMCRHVCTLGIVDGKESDTPRGRNLILSKLQKGYIAYSDELIDTIYRCCLCGMCQTWCKAGCTPPAATLAARADIVAQGKEPERVQQIRENLLKTGNPFGLPAKDRFKAIESRDLFCKKADVLFYVGCDVAYRQPEIADAFIKILRHAKVNFTLLPEEGTTGKPLRLLGYRDDARAAAESLLRKIRATKCKALVTSCPSSFDAFKKDYPAMGLDLKGIEVLHATQYLDGLLKEKRILPRKKLQESTTLLDGTYLGREHRLFEEPRRVLRAASRGELREMTWSRELAYACGEPGGIFQLLYPQLSLALCQRVLVEAEATGSNVLAVTCPATKGALTAAKSSKVQVRDVVEMLADSL